MRVRWEGRNHYMYLMPDRRLRGETFCGKSIQHGASSTNFTSARKKPHEYPGISASHSLWCKEMQWTSRVCHHYLTAVGFWGCSIFDLFIYYYFFPSAHTWCVEGSSCTDLASSCKCVRTSRSLNERSTVRVGYVICGSDPTRRVSYVSELQFEIRDYKGWAEREEIVGYTFCR